VTSDKIITKIKVAIMDKYAEIALLLVRGSNPWLNASETHSRANELVESAINQNLPDSPNAIFKELVKNAHLKITR
jgi:hypothetical protein